MTESDGSGRQSGANPLRSAIRAAYRSPETDVVSQLADQVRLSPEAAARARTTSMALVKHIRKLRRKVGGIDALMQEYDLSSEEGVILMCLAEALLRIPDEATQDAFIKDQIQRGDWSSHIGHSESLFANASTFGLLMAGRIVSADRLSMDQMGGLVRRLGAPVVRTAIYRAMRILGRQFVLASTITKAVNRAKAMEAKGYRFSYDMLGESAWTMADADRYFETYAAAIRAVGAVAGNGPVETRPGVSVKLSALHPRYEYAQLSRVESELKDRLIALCELAASLDVGLTVDAEETDRLDMSLDLIEAAASHAPLGDWQGLGLAVQAYQRRALPVLDWVVDLATRTGRRLMVRLVKGAYWDTEIKRAQIDGVADFPVFTRKHHTDISYLACAKRMLAAGAAIYPCFATHNANTLGVLMEMIGDRKDLEFQRLHGMGEALFQKVVEQDESQLACRIYGPVGGHEDLLAYLVRRLLENGANTSFVNRISDDATPIEEIVRDPVKLAESWAFSPHPGIRQPSALFGDERVNSCGWDLTDPDTVDGLLAGMNAARHKLEARPTVCGDRYASAPIVIKAPGDLSDEVGSVVHATAGEARDALALSVQGARNWSAVPVGRRADILRAAADLMESDSARLMSLIVREAGRTIKDAHLELREAVDFLRYYAAGAERLMGDEVSLPGPTGEHNTLRLVGRGPILCISPWNFPAAIFAGQVAGALATGCSVLAKPAEQTPLVAAEIVNILHRAGIPQDALFFLPGDGPEIAAALCGDDRLAGVVFTGGFDTARIINRELAKREGPIIPFIAETGGINAMIVDSTALAEQVTRDVAASAFQSAGQRCSALRLLLLQEDVADDHLGMIIGAVRERRLGDPMALSTDIGPIIDAEALEGLRRYVASISQDRVLYAGEIDHETAMSGHFMAPVIVALDKVSDLKKEVFGPVLHVVRWRAHELDQLVEEINGLGFGLTLSIHSRNQSCADYIAGKAEVGNVYINRNQIGAVVGVQPFGGEKRSGTGPKAGGPHYLMRFCHERVVSEDVTAAGGNVDIMKQ